MSSVIINKKNLKQLIEPHFHNDLYENEYQIERVRANQLLTHTRLDIAFKLLYLDMLEYDAKFATHIYKEHIRAFSLGKFTEFGNEDKNSVEKFIDDFNSTFNSIKNDGFNSRRTLIPLSKNGSIVNGSHRVASAIFLDIDIDCVKIDARVQVYDYKFFYERNISRHILDVVVTKFVEYASNVYLAFIWPTAIGHDKEIEAVIQNIVYRKDIKLNSNGAHNLLSQIYYGEEWLGGVENNFKGCQGKLIACFKTFEPIRIMAFQATNLDEVLKIKTKIREIFKVDKHSVHITDTKKEAIRTAKIVFNDNSIHFLNYAKPNKYLSTHRKLDTFKAFIKQNHINTDEVLLDSGMVLSLYGLRESSDIDYFVVDNTKIVSQNSALESHDEVLKYHDEDKIELIFNAKYYFYFNDIKFISFQQLYKMKANRAEEKDINDCKIMEALIENDKFKEFINKSKQIIFYTKIKLTQKIIYILKTIGIYYILRDNYRKMKS